MKIKNIISVVATLLNKDNVLDYLKSQAESGDALEVVDRLVRLSNLVVSELSSYSFYLVKKDKVQCENGKIYYADLSTSPIKILDVLDADGFSVDYTVNTFSIDTLSGEKTVVYAYYPTNFDMEEEFESNNKLLSEYIIALGVCAEYCLTIGDFDGALAWHEKYTDNLKKIAKIKNTIVKQRSWQ